MNCDIAIYILNLKIQMHYSYFSTIFFFRKNIFLQINIVLWINNVSYVTEIGIAKTFVWWFLYLLSVAALKWKYLWLIVVLKALFMAKCKPPARGNQNLGWNFNLWCHQSSQKHLNHQPQNTSKKCQWSSSMFYTWYQVFFVYSITKSSDFWTHLTAAYRASYRSNDGWWNSDAVFFETFSSLQTARFPNTCCSQSGD